MTANAPNKTKTLIIQAPETSPQPEKLTYTLTLPCTLGPKSATINPYLHRKRVVAVKEFH